MLLVSCWKVYISCFLTWESSLCTSSDSNYWIETWYFRKETVISIQFHVILVHCCYHPDDWLFTQYAIASLQQYSKQLEETMDRFAQGEIKILICTNIVESGLDIQNANTIIIQEVQQFGLAQLYQVLVFFPFPLCLIYFLNFPEMHWTWKNNSRNLCLKTYVRIGISWWNFYIWFGNSFGNFSIFWEYEYF